MGVDADQGSAIFSRLMDMQSEYNNKIGGVYDILREQAAQDTKMIASLDRMTEALHDLVRRIEDAERVKHSTPCDTACGLKTKLEAQERQIDEIFAKLRSMEQEKQERKKTWSEVMMHIVKYLTAAAVGGLIFLVGAGLSAWAGKLAGGQ